MHAAQASSPPKKNKEKHGIEGPDKIRTQTRSLVIVPCSVYDGSTRYADELPIAGFVLGGVLDKLLII